MEVKSPAGYFLRFFPLEYAVKGLGPSQALYDSKYSDIRVNFEQAHLVRFIGVLLKMTIVPHGNMDQYWK